MKKIFKKSNIFSFLLGAIIFSGITSVAAYNILASDIGYTPKEISLTALLRTAFISVW